MCDFALKFKALSQPQQDNARIWTPVVYARGRLRFRIPQHWSARARRSTRDRVLLLRASGPCSGPDTSERAGMKEGGSERAGMKEGGASTQEQEHEIERLRACERREREREGGKREGEGLREQGE
jgi:hypothetical protein